MKHIASKSNHSNIIIFSITTSAILSIAISISKYSFLPPRFFFDATMIKRFMDESPAFDFFDSYSTTAIFYKIIPGGSSVFLVSLLSILFCIFVAWQAVRAAGGAKNPDLTFALIISVYLALSSIFLAQHSKDFIVLTVVSAYLFLSKYEKKGFIFFVVIALTYAILFRQYWIIIAGFFIFSTFMQRKKFSLIRLLITCSLMLLALSLLFELILGVPLSHYRSIVNEVRINNYDINAQTIITNILPTGNFILEWLNALITWLALMFPAPLLMLFTAYHITNFVLISSIFIILFSLRKTAASNLRARSGFILLICFTFVQSIFEPDYGSFLRHFTPMLPILIFLYAMKLNMKIKTI